MGQTWKAPFVGKSCPVGRNVDKGAQAGGKLKGTFKVFSAFALGPKGSKKGAWEVPVN